MQLELTNYQAYLTRKALLYKMHVLLDMGNRVYISKIGRETYMDAADELAEIIDLFDKPEETLIGDEAIDYANDDRW